jgi:hypothetical protein
VRLLFFGGAKTIIVVESLKRVIAWINMGDMIHERFYIQGINKKLWVSIARGILCQNKGNTDVHTQPSTEQKRESQC